MSPYKFTMHDAPPIGNFFVHEGHLACFGPLNRTSKATEVPKTGSGAMSTILRRIREVAVCYNFTMYLYLYIGLAYQQE